MSTEDTNETKTQKPPTPPTPPPPAPKKPFFAEAYRYVGGGYVPGVPDHDLTSADVARVSPDYLREVHASPFYEPATDAELKGGK